MKLYKQHNQRLANAMTIINSRGVNESVIADLHRLARDIRRDGPGMSDKKTELLMEVQLLIYSITARS